MKICGYLKRDRIFLDVEPGPKTQVLRNIVERLGAAGLIAHPDKVFASLIEREGLGSTGLEKGIAVPHALIEGIQDTLLAVSVIRGGTDFQALDQKPTFVLIILLGSADQPGQQLRVLAHICRLIKETAVVEKIRKAQTADEIYEIFSREEEKIV